MNRHILLSLDVEEFDVPLEYGCEIDFNSKMRVSSEGLNCVLDLLDRLDIRTTCFVTADYAKNETVSFRRILERHELASHGMTHSTFTDRDLLPSRIELERLSGRKVIGFRSPHLTPVSAGAVKAAGYLYNSSENPVWIPGRYMNLFRPRLPYLVGDILNLPLSATPVIRYPLFWLSFKNSPLWLIKQLSSWTLASDQYLNIFFHPWEFSDLSSWQVPDFIKRASGRQMLAKLESYLVWLMKRGTFITCAEFMGKIKSLDG